MGIARAAARCWRWIRCGTRMNLRRKAVRSTSACTRREWSGAAHRSFCMNSRFFRGRWASAACATVWKRARRRRACSFPMARSDTGFIRSSISTASSATRRSITSNSAPRRSVWKSAMAPTFRWGRSSLSTPIAAMRYRFHRSCGKKRCKRRKPCRSWLRKRRCPRLPTVQSAKSVRCRITASQN